MPEGKGWGASQSPPTASPALDVSAQGGRASSRTGGACPAPVWCALVQQRASGTCKNRELGCLSVLLAVPPGAGPPGALLPARLHDVDDLSSGTAEASPPASGAPPWACPAPLPSGMVVLYSRPTAARPSEGGYANEEAGTLLPGRAGQHGRDGPCVGRGSSVEPLKTQVAPVGSQLRPGQKLVIL